MQMVYRNLIFFLSCSFVILFPKAYSQTAGIGFEKTIESNASVIPTSLPYSRANLLLLEEHFITIKYITKDWIYFNLTKEELNNLSLKKEFSALYFEYAPPTLLDDSARVMHHVDEVHAGLFPLPEGYTGKDVIIGVVDAGLDHNHPDFIDENGVKRLIRYWDHAVANPTNPPHPYNYGQLWSRQEILNGSITSTETTVSHGTTVTGIAAGNGLGNGRNKGFAPDCDIIAVKSDFSLPNWTLTIADACDFIFKVADTLGKSAVVNLSLGTYLGSHDAKDPAGQAIDAMLDAKPGRIVVCAAGNSGNEAKYHVRNDNINANTSFVWFKNNPSGSIGANTIYFDLWSDLPQAEFFYSFGANLPNGSFAERGVTSIYYAQANLGGEIRDTIYNSSGQRIATIRAFPKVVGSNYNLAVLFNNVDSTLYNYSFKTTGAGSYDLWSGTFIGLNKIVDQIPDASFYPPIVYYVMPDSLQSIVSSWNCSEKVVSVGNLRARLGHIDKNNNQYYPSEMTTPGKIGMTSSRGPSRKNYIKPDICAGGDVTLAAGTSTILNNPANNSRIDQGGLHIRNGGTSMASPVVAGTAALFLENCQKANWLDFKTALFATAGNDSFTGNLPNVTYGNGKLNVYELMSSLVIPLTIFGDPLLCQQPQLIGSFPSIDSYYWSNGDSTQNALATEPGELYLVAEDDNGCNAYSDTLFITQGNVPLNPIITNLDGALVSSNGPNIQWYFNDNTLINDTNQVIFPNQYGFYSVSFTSEDGCTSYSTAFNWTALSLEEISSNQFTLFPNPSTDKITIQSEELFSEVHISNSQGQRIATKTLNPSNEYQFSVSEYARGVYFVKIQLKSGSKTMKLIKE
jgi:subtilisin family serine protease